MKNVNNIGSNIKRIRGQKGYSQEFMALQLNISQASYARMESQEIKLSIDRLQKIADILEIDISIFFKVSKIETHEQINNEDTYNRSCIENLRIENKETLKKLIQTLENENEHLKTEIKLLFELIKKQ